MPTTQTKPEQDLDYYKVEVFGDYFTSTAEGGVVRPFGPVTLKMRDWHNCQNLARSHVLPTLLRKADVEFKQIRRCIVVGVMTYDDHPVHNLPIAFMSREQITLECRSNKIPLRTEMYIDIIKLRGKLKFARLDPVKFAKAEAKNTEAFARVGDALELNANVFSDIARANAEGSDEKKLLNKDMPESLLKEHVIAEPLSAEAASTDENEKAKASHTETHGGVDVTVTDPNLEVQGEDNKKKTDDEIEDFDL